MSKYRLTQAQLRSLTVEHRPDFDAKGRTILVPNPGKKPYRFADGNQGAPGGFTIYVGSQGARYEIRARIQGKAVRIALGPVAELSLARAHELASETRGHIRLVGEDPRETLKTEAAAREARGTTIKQAMDDYIRWLEHRKTQGKVKQNGVDGAVDSLARLSRPEVNLASKTIAELNDEKIREAWRSLRQSAMQRSNRISKETKKRLKDSSWQDLTHAELIARFNLSGAQVERVHAAGLAAAEHTMGDVFRAVERILAAERKSAAHGGRPVALSHNPFSVLRDEGYFRSTRELRRHYEAARTRNPLGVDDAETGQKSLPTVLKAIVARRDHQNGHNAAAVDYLLLLLLWGTRRSELARLRWFSSCTPEEMDPSLRLASWVWIAPSPEARHPATRFPGSQVFFHDTKNGDSLLLPVAYFAQKVLGWREATRDGSIKALKQQIQRATMARDKARVGSAKRVEALQALEKAQWRLEQVQRWVFPARNPKAKEGHYTDPKSIIANVRKDAGISAGLTPHDFRRTLGRMAAKLLPGHLVSQLLHHTSPDDPEAMAPVSERYTQQEWGTLREAMEKVDEAIIATSPKVWNILKGSDRPRLDEVNDP